MVQLRTGIRPRKTPVISNKNYSLYCISKSIKVAAKALVNKLLKLSSFFRKGQLAVRSFEVAVRGFEVAVRGFEVAVRSFEVAVGSFKVEVDSSELAIDAIRSPLFPLHNIHYICCQ